MPKGLKGFQKGHGFLGNDDTRAKLSAAGIGREYPNRNVYGANNPFFGKTHTPEIRQRIRLAHLGKPLSTETRTKISESHRGEKAYQWKADRTQLKRHDERNDSAYIGWMRAVKTRDDNKCRLADENCFGRTIAHHILPWATFPEDRYNTRNGITLCQAHHPKKRAEEMRLVPALQSIVTNNH